MHDLFTFKTQCHKKKPGYINFSMPLAYYKEDSTILKLELVVKNSAVKTKWLCFTSVKFQERNCIFVNFLGVRKFVRRYYSCF